MATVGSWDSDLRKLSLFDKTIPIEGRFDPDLTKGTVRIVDISGHAITSSEGFGLPTLLQVLAILPTAVGSASSFGIITVQRGTVTLYPTAISSSETIGTLVLLRGAVNILPVSIGSNETFGLMFIGLGGGVGTVVPESAIFFKDIADLHPANSLGISSGPVIVIPVIVGTPLLVDLKPKT